MWCESRRPDAGLRRIGREPAKVISRMCVCVCVCVCTRDPWGHISFHNVTLKVNKTSDILWKFTFIATHSGDHCVYCWEPAFVNLTIMASYCVWSFVQGTCRQVFRFNIVHCWLGLWDSWLCGGRLQYNVLQNNIALNPLQPSGHYMYRQFNIQQFYVLPTQLYLCVLCVSQNKQRLFPYTALTDWFV